MTGAPGLPGKDGEPGIRGKFVEYFLKKLYLWSVKTTLLSFVSGKPPKPLARQ